MSGPAASAIHAMPAACRSTPPARSGRSPTRPIRAPATGATRNSVAVHGSSRTPAASGPWPCAVWRNWAMKKTAPRMAPKRKKPAALPAANARGRSEALGQAPARERREHEPERDVQPEDPLPGDSLGDGAADDRAAEDGEAGHAAEDPERG